MAAKAADRLVWAVETLTVRPADHLLEIGCGHGVAVSLICERLAGGRITAIDRSEKMIAMAIARNRACIASGTAVFHAVSLADAEFGDERFDKIFAFHVRELWMQPAGELGIVRKLLKPGGRLYLFNQLPQWKEERDLQSFVKDLTNVLHDGGLAVRETLFHELKPTPAVCVIAEVSS
ncbi:MAG: class I SAM-dependent methyltransferase [Dehalococcoidia bacterium]